LSSGALQALFAILPFSCGCRDSEQELLLSKGMSLLQTIAKRNDFQAKGRKVFFGGKRIA
jgi:hypothetical protein